MLLQQSLLKFQDRNLEPGVLKITTLIVRFPSIFLLYILFLVPSPPSPILACLCPKPFPLLNYLACDTVATVQLSFGSKYWTIDPVDFRLTRLNGSDCLGAFFVLPSGSSAPSWIIGDTFLVRSTISFPNHHES